MTINFELIYKLKIEVCSFTAYPMLILLHAYKSETSRTLYSCALLILGGSV